jgi:hypothetical protein
MGLCTLPVMRARFFFFWLMHTTVTTMATMQQTQQRKTTPPTTDPTTIPTVFQYAVTVFACLLVVYQEYQLVVDYNKVKTFDR